MKHWRIEIVAFISAIFLTLLSVLWFGIRSGMAAKVDASLVIASGSDYISLQKTDPIQFSPVNWDKPKPQPRGKVWVYEIFTPPRVFYDLDSRTFRVSPLEGESERLTSMQDGFGLELLAVVPTQFPLQLQGFVGEEGHFLGTFENKVTFETLLLATGDYVDSLELSIVELKVERVVVHIPDSMKVSEYRATALVRHDRTGQLLTLEQGVTLQNNELSVQLMFTGQPDIVTLSREGESLSNGENLFTIGEIKLSPPSVNVTKESTVTVSIIQQTLKIKPHAVYTGP